MDRIRSEMKNLPMPELAMALALGVSINLLAGLLQTLVLRTGSDAVHRLTVPGIVLTFLISASCLVQVYRRRRIFGFPRARLSQAQSRPARVLVLLLSPSDWKQAGKLELTQATWHFPLHNSPTDPRLGNPPNAQVVAPSPPPGKGAARQCLHRDLTILAGGPRWNWTQALRALYPHLGDGEEKLNRLVVLGSPGRDGSACQRVVFRELLGSYVPPSIIDISAPAVDFLDFQVLSDAVRRAMDDALEHCQRDAAIGVSTSTERPTQKDIVIDVTGGEKTASIAAAAVTLSSEASFQYVSTRPIDLTDPTRDVLVYDISYDAPPNA